MKKKLIIIISIISAFFIIGLGVSLKMKEGYTLSTDKEIIEVMGKIVNNIPDAVEILQKRIYKNEDNQLMLVVVRSQGMKILQIFQENEYQRYEEYYNYILDDKTVLMLTDSRHKSTYVICNNEFRQIAGISVISETDVSGTKPIMTSGKYIIECYNIIDEAMFINLVDENGDIIENFSFAQETIKGDIYAKLL